MKSTAKYLDKMLKNVTDPNVSELSAFAKNVLPTPLGPCINTPIK